MSICELNARETRILQWIATTVTTLSMDDPTAMALYSMGLVAGSDRWVVTRQGVRQLLGFGSHADTNVEVEPLTLGQRQREVRVTTVVRDEELMSTTKTICDTHVVSAEDLVQLCNPRVEKGSTVRVYADTESGCGFLTGDVRVVIERTTQKGSDHED